MEPNEITEVLTHEGRKIEKLHTLEVISVCLDAIEKKEVTIKYEGDDQTHIYIGGEYFQTLPGSQWAKIVNLVIDVTGKAYTKGATDVIKGIVKNLK